MGVRLADAACADVNKDFAGAGVRNQDGLDHGRFVLGVDDHSLYFVHGEFSELRRESRQGCPGARQGYRLTWRWGTGPSAM
ncbi:hypothetical protein GCM10009595_06690 [Falsarthrobacter nasiphocae]